MNSIDTAKQFLSMFDGMREEITKYAFTPMAPPAQPVMAGPPPGDPNAGMMPPGAPMPPPGDPNAGMMPPGVPMPPLGDPNAGMMPPPPQGGAPQGTIPPELEQLISQLASGMDGVSQSVAAQQNNVDKLSERLLAMEQELSDMRAEKKQQEAEREALEAPAGFEGGDDLAALQEQAPPVEEAQPQQKSPEQVPQQTV